MRAPIGLLKPTAVTEAFQALIRKSGLSIPYHGPHCLRHYAASRTMPHSVCEAAPGGLAMLINTA
jgi:hypothetical protein